MADKKGFKPGDRVKLKSGGPNMIVDGHDMKIGGLRCQWFTGSKLNTGTFAPETLVAVDESEAKSPSHI